jgi:signal transduction histidine kinase
MTASREHAGSAPEALTALGRCAVAIVALALSGAAVASTLTGRNPGDVAFSVALAASVAVPVAVGLRVWREQVYARFGRLLVVVGLASFLPTLASSDEALLYSTGRLAAWAIHIAIIYLLLSFPTGRLPGRTDRLLVGAGVALVLVLYLPTALLVEQYPVPNDWAACRTGCPANAFMLIGSEPSWVDGIVVPIRELLTVVLFIAVPVRLAVRVVHATVLTRRTLTPVLGAAIVSTLAVAVGLVVRRADPDSAAIELLVLLLVAGLPLVSLGFLVGTFAWRLHVAGAVQRLALGLRASPRPAALRDVVAQALGDPTVELAFWSDRGPSRWLDAAGAPVAPPAARPGRSWTEIRDGEGHVVTVVHDPALDDQRPVVAAVGTYALVGLVGYENHRLAGDVDRSLRQLADSRARIQAAADDERRRIERDLHDGAQQRLVALGIRLELAAESMGADQTATRAILRELGTEVTGALDEVRSLATDVYPAVLADLGLADALRAAGRRSPVPATVAVHGTASWPQDIEAAVYFCCLEAMQNAVKHAPDATSLSVVLDLRGDLRFEVRDDGPGFSLAEDDAGHGLVNMRDRIEAVGGRLDVFSACGAGTRVSGSIPLAAS